MSSQSVKIDGATKVYGDFKACDHVSLDIQKGEFFTLLGPSGCGKTTLLRMIAGFNTIDDGKIFFGERELNSIPAHLRNIGMVFQNYAIFPHLSVKDNVAYGLKARKIKGEKLESAAREAMEMMQIEMLADRMPGQLSGGQQQRVALARAIVIEPDILLMDEPLCNLDAKLRVTMRTSIKKLQRKLGITTIYVTHDPEEALSISDRIAVMRAGKVMQIGGPREIYDNPANMFVANFIGTSCFLDGTAKNGKVRILDAADVNARVDPAFAGKVKVSVRPEHFIIESKPTDGAIRGTITLATFLGDFICYEIQLSNGQIIEANEYTDRMRIVRSVGDEVGLRFVEERINVFDAETEESIMQ